METDGCYEAWHFAARERPERACIDPLIFGPRMRALQATSMTECQRTDGILACRFGVTKPQTMESD